MDNVGKRVLVVILAVYALAFLGFAGYSYYQFGHQDILPVFQLNWIASNSVILFLRTLIPIHCFAVLLSYSLFVNPMELRASTGTTASFLALLRTPVILFLILTLLYTVAVGVFLPRTVDARERARYQSQTAREFKALGSAALDQKRYEDAVTHLNRYLEINPEDTQAAGMLEAARNHVRTDSGRQEVAEQKQFTPAAEMQDLDLDQLLGKSRTAFENEDFFSAHYYATLALDLDRNSRQARELAARALERISSQDLSNLEAQKKTIYEQKRRGYLALFRDDKPLDAYYIFEKLHEQYPRDPDVMQYYPQVLDAVRQVSFFIGDATQAESLPGEHNVIFINHRRGADREFIYFNKLVRSPDGTFGFGVEAISFTTGSDITYHLTAPYAKLIDDQINMQAIDRTDSGKRVMPTYLTGSRPADIRHLLSLDVDPVDLPVVSKGAGDLKQAGIAELWRMTQIFPDHGLKAEPIYLEMGMRLLLPFSFVILSFFSLAIGWRWRSRYINRPPLLSLLLIPLFPVVLYFLFLLYMHIYRIIFSFLLLYSGFTVAVITFVALQAILLVLSLISLAGQMSE